MVFDWFRRQGQQVFQRVITPVAPKPGTIGAAIPVQPSPRPIPAPAPTYIQPPVQPIPTIPIPAPAPIIKVPPLITVEQKGYELAKGVFISDISKSVYKHLSGIAEQIKRGEPIVSEKIRAIPTVGAPTAFITSRGTKTIAGLIETAGMIPGGVEILAKKPDIIPAAAIAGTAWTAQGVATQLKEDPAQLAIDLWLTKKTFDLAGRAQAKVLIGIERGIPPIKTPAIPSLRVPAVELPAIKVPGVEAWHTLIGEAKSIAKMPEGLLPEKQIKYRAILDVAERLQRTPPETQRPLDFTKVRTLANNKKAAMETEAWLKSISKREDLVIGGSGASWVWIKGFRSPKDLDINVKNPARVAKEGEAVLVRHFGRENVKVDFDERSGSYQVSRKINGEWRHVLDLHKPEPTGALIERVGLPIQEPVTVGGLQYKTFGELLARKIDSAVRPQPGGIIAPQPHRIVKDLADLEVHVGTAFGVYDAQIAKSIPLLKELRQYKLTKAQESYESYKMHVSFGGLEAYPEIARMYGTLPYTTRRIPQMLVLTGLKPPEFTNTMSRYSELKPKPVVEPYKPPYVPPKKLTPSEFTKAIPYRVPTKKLTPSEFGTVIEKYPKPKPPYKPSVKIPVYKPPYKPPTKVPPYKPPYKPPPTKIPPYKPLYKPPTKPTITERLPKTLLPSKFIDTTKKFKKNKKQSGLYVWDIKNPVPDLETLLESI